MGDLTDFLTALALNGLVAGIVTVGGIKAGPVVTKWGVQKLLGMFGR